MCYMVCCYDYIWAICTTPDGYALPTFPSQLHQFRYQLFKQLTYCKALDIIYFTSSHS